MLFAAEGTPAVDVAIDMVDVGVCGFVIGFGLHILYMTYDC